MAASETPWGYDVELDAGESIPEILSVARFHEMTAYSFVDDDRIAHAIAAAAARIRSFCGWHVVGSLDCIATLDGGERRLWLPSTHVTALTSVTVCGVDVTDSCEWSRRGELRLPWSPDVLGAVVVAFTSGFAEVPGEIEGLLAHRVVHEVALPFGIASETIGSTSRTYSANAADGTGTCHLTSSDREALSAYRLVEAR